MRKSPFCDLGFDKCIYEPVLHILITGACLIMFSNDWGRTVSQTCWGVLQEDRMPLSQPLRWCCVDCVIHHERDVREEHKYMHVARTSNNRVIPMEWSWWVTSYNACEPGEQLIVLANGDNESDLYCCLLQRYEALHTCRSGFPITTLNTCPET